MKILDKRWGTNNKTGFMKSGETFIHKRKLYIINHITKNKKVVTATNLKTGKISKFDGNQIVEEIVNSEIYIQD